jgi:hypothetical protein
VLRSGGGGEGYLLAGELFELADQVTFPALRACCQEIRSTDEISLKLLAAVPVVTGVGIGLSIPGSHGNGDESARAIIVGLFGALASFAIYRWELRNIQTCGWYLACAAELEEKYLVPRTGTGERLDPPHRRPAPPALNVAGRRIPAGGIGKTSAVHLLYTTIVGAWLTLVLYAIVAIAL